MGKEQTQAGLGDFLVRERLISQGNLNQALEQQRASSKSIGRILVDMGLISESMRTTLLQKEFGYSLVRLKDRPIEPLILALIPYSFAEKHHIVPVEQSRDGKLVVAMEDPSDMLLVDALKNQIGLNIEPRIAVKEDIQYVLSLYQTGAELARKQAEESVQQRVWFRLIKHGAFPVLALAPLVLFLAGTYYDLLGIRGYLLDQFENQIINEWDLAIYIGLGWGLWTVILYEINGLIFGRKGSEDEEH